MAFGVVSRFPDHLRHFAPAYYEVKDVTGVWHEAVPHAIPMISAFGDNKLAKTHPEWVQIGPGGERATRESRYFDWDAICPSQDAVFKQGLEWVQAAVGNFGQNTVRLDDVTFARDGFCQCAACIRESRTRDLSLEEYRAERLVEFVHAARQIVPHVEMTIFPDPFPGHLMRRFGIDTRRLADEVERFVVPIYDLHYATTYWLEVLAQAFAETLTRPWYVELYGLKVPEEALLHACEVVQTYADGVIVAYDNQLDKLMRIQERLAVLS